MSLKNLNFSMFDSDCGLEIGEKNPHSTNEYALGKCGIFINCGGGGGQCSFGATCGGGGGKCSFGATCSGS